MQHSVTVASSWSPQVQLFRSSSEDETTVNAWVLQTDMPSGNATSIESCDSFTARLLTDDASAPPLGQSTWEVQGDEDDHCKHP